jgi:hypothetical protein
VNEVLHQIEQHDAELEERAKTVAYFSVINAIGGAAVLLGSAAFVFAALRYFGL